MKLTKSQLILTVAAVVLIVVAGVVLFRLNKKNTLSCPEGFMLMGKKDPACLKVYPGDLTTSTSDYYKNANLQYQLAEDFDSRNESGIVTVVLGKPESPKQAQELLSKNNFECVGAYVYDIKTKLYTSVSISTNCSSFEKYLPEGFVIYNDSDHKPKAEDLLVLSVKIKGVPKVIRNFWKDNTERIRAVSYFFDYRNYPKIDE